MILTHGKCSGGSHDGGSEKEEDTVEQETLL